MKTSQKAYMRREEFKARQQCFEFLAKFQKECLNGWKKLFCKTVARFENRTLWLPFEQLTHEMWQKKAAQLWLKLV